ncbi:WD40 repeat-like protein [Periconia macrospinosa]|uniref:WD40 repeat-like protein n=1 Tax=Periconia macrospinosa TaxID=97972 RepID=A0A2V1DQC4_9PLEO|nr:WD40 repeat-like protein [Periconia macrospinosa]
MADETMNNGPDAVPDEEQIMENKLINEEYKIWKKNSVFLYDMLYARALEWPTLTTQWLPDKKHIDGTNLSLHRAILGTHTSNQAQNYLQIAHVEIPDLRTPDLSELNERGEVGGHGHARQPFEYKIAQRINHPDEVNKARYQPQNPEIIASSCVNGDILIFDRTKHPMQPKDNTIKYEAALKGHSGEGFGLAWNSVNEGHLVTGNEDKTVRTWDLRGGFSKDSKGIDPTATYTVHSATVNDVQYHPTMPSIIGSVSDDLTWQGIDTRQKSRTRAMWRKVAHSDQVNCLAFHPDPKFETLLATGSSDKTIAIWDLRNFDRPLHTLQGHNEGVMGLQWHPQDPSVLASSSNDRRIRFWDLSKIGEEQTPDEAEEGPPELIFMHGGFTNRICDFDFNKNEPWVMMGAAEDNQLQIFRPARKLVEPLPENTNHGEGKEPVPDNNNLARSPTPTSAAHSPFVPEPVPEPERPCPAPAPAPPSPSPPPPSVVHQENQPVSPPPVASPELPTPSEETPVASSSPNPKRPKHKRNKSSRSIIPEAPWHLNTRDKVERITSPPPDYPQN